jgi:hypothetical protein
MLTLLGDQARHPPVTAVAAVSAPRLGEAGAAAQYLLV